MGKKKRTSGKENRGVSDMPSRKPSTKSGEPQKPTIMKLDRRRHHASKQRHYTA
jgi:hypothetical protein